MNTNMQKNKRTALRDLSADLSKRELAATDLRLVAGGVQWEETCDKIASATFLDHPNPLICR
jgi:hypothetical protein